MTRYWPYVAGAAALLLLGWWAWRRFAAAGAGTTGTVNPPVGGPRGAPPTRTTQMGA